MVGLLKPGGEAGEWEIANGTTRLQQTSDSLWAMTMLSTYEGFELYVLPGLVPTLLANPIRWKMFLKPLKPRRPAVLAAVANWQIISFIPRCLQCAYFPNWMGMRAFNWTEGRPNHQSVRWSREEPTASQDPESVLPQACNNLLPVPPRTFSELKRRGYTFTWMQRE